MTNSNVKVQMKNLVIEGTVAKVEGQNVYVQGVQGGVYKFHKDMVEVLPDLSQVEKTIDELLKEFGAYIVDGTENSIILEGDYYTVNVWVYERDGKVVYQMNTINNRLNASNKRKMTYDYSLREEDLKSAYGNESERKTYKGVVGYIKKYLGAA